MRATIASLLRIALLARVLSAQEPILVQRLSGPIHLDGRSDEPAWQDVTPVGLTTFLPVAGRRPNDSSEVRLGYDEEHLYVAGRFYASDPSQIQATSLTRDRLGPDDRFRIMLDTYNDAQTGVGFMTTPAGIRVDIDVAAEGQVLDTSWNTYWDVATARDDRGWYAEMRIPFSSLRFQPDPGGRVTMGLILLRVSAKKNESATFPALSPTYAAAVWRPSLARKIVFEGLHRRRPAYFTAYALGGLDRRARLSAGADAWRHASDGTTELGGDLKYGVSDNLTLDVTANTDFAQVEADNQVVNLTRFSLFFPERRQFFQERAGAFDFSTDGVGDNSRLFHSRRIGLTDDGRKVRIYGGARLVGRARGLDVGFLDLQTADDSLQPGANLGVLRLRQRVLNPSSWVGGILTSRLDVGGGHNVVYGADASLRVFGNDYLTAQWAQSFDDRVEAGSGSSGLARMEWGRPGAQGWRYNAGVKWVGPAFTTRLGFEPRSDYHVLYGIAGFGWLPGGSTVLQMLQPTLYGYAFHRNADGSLESGQIYPYVNVAFKSGLSGWVGWVRTIEDLREALPLSATVEVPPGRHSYDQVQAYLSSPPGHRFGYNITLYHGGLYDGRQLFADLSSSYSISQHLRVGATWQRNRLRFPSRDETLDADVIRLRVDATLNPKLSAAALVQYNRAADVVVANWRVRYQFAEGRDLYLVYDEIMNTDRAEAAPGQPRLPRSQQRALLVKYTYTFASGG